MNKLFLAALGVLVAGVAGARDINFTVGEHTLKFTVTNEADKTCELAADAANADVTGDIVIPGTITEGDDTYRVTSVANKAFADNSKVTSVTLANSVKTIGENAFSNCSNLQTVTFGDELTTIEANAFNGCTAMTTVNFSTNLKTIGAQAFYNCSNLTNVTLIDPLETIGASAFYGCGSLESLNIPATIKTLGQNAFEGCDQVSGITYDTLEPITCNNNVFDGIMYFAANLYVPAEAMVTFQNTAPWNNFMEISPIADPTSAVETVSATLDLNAPMKLYSISGSEVSQDEANAMPGVYLYKQGDKTGKIVIR